MKTTFFGSGPVAAESLKKLVEWQDVTAVVTKQTPPHHKESAPVEELAKDLRLPIFYAANKKDLDNLLDNPDFKVTEFGIVIDFGVIISQKVIDKYKFGIINSHFSLLPQWRGADPISYSILSGQQQTGVSIMLIDKGMDTGPLLSLESLDIYEEDTNVTLTSKLIDLSDKLLATTITRYLKGQIKPTDQPKIIATYSSMLNKTYGLITPDKTASELAREIRAYAGWPNSRLLYKDLWITVTRAKQSSSKIVLGSLEIIEGSLYYGCKNGSLEIIELKPAGKKNMSATAFINGYAHILN